VLIKSDDRHRLSRNPYQNEMDGDCKWAAGFVWFGGLGSKKRENSTGVRVVATVEENNLQYEVQGVRSGRSSAPPQRWETWLGGADGDQQSQLFSRQAAKGQRGNDDHDYGIALHHTKYSTVR